MLMLPTKPLTFLKRTLPRVSCLSTSQSNKPRIPNAEVNIKRSLFLCSLHLRLVKSHHLEAKVFPSKQIRRYAEMALTPSTDPLVWIDCEMTGLDPNTDRILGISCYITDHELNSINKKGYHAIISTPRPVLDAMGEWCQRTHAATGLIEACLSSSAISAEQASSQLLSYIQQHVPEPRTALLAGNSVHADKMFLTQRPWAPVLEHLHYRILDISAIKEAARRWCGEDVLAGVPKKKLTHSADEDIRESIEEAKYYMGLFRGFDNARGRSGQDARDGTKRYEED